ncbi:related to capsule polysaccharide biosynthesis protein [Cephalotrichum gorgonifer]|uniref:Related to capsule polysaccharide biosynthesis protein n=1 Tax=Cephalotrichum gorgonifer TaxID=2041049 RepID=A0AAE8N8R7_9PEZI|nr:related to capsule polysaccharide biosynthesis protein [Cephalotrichum gorgonifer]
MATFEIPESYLDKLEVIEVEDTRTDEEILSSLNEHAPVTSEKNIWALWYDGVLNMPAWCKRNAVDWVRICGPEWTVRVLDNVPESPNYALRYLSPQNLPGCFVNWTMDGPYVGQHAADFVRSASILEHGGAWMDTGSIMVMHMDRICWDNICDPHSPYEVATVLRGDQWIFNYFIAAKKNNPFIRRLNELVLHLWKDRNNHKGVTHNALFSYIMKTMPASDTQTESQTEPQQQQKPSGGMALFDWKVSMQELLDYAMQMAAWNRVALLEDAGDGFSGTEYWTRHMLLLDFAPETGMPMKMLGAAKNGGERMLDLLSMRKQQPNKNDFREAERVVWETLAHSSMWKISHVKGMTHKPQLGSLLDAPENLGKDQAPGTFMEVLRYGTVHFRQKRQSPGLRDAPRPEFTLKVGLLEP